MTTNIATAQATKTIRALRLHARNDIRLDEIESTPCGSDEVRLKIAFCGICGTDIHEYLGGPIFAPQSGTKNQYTHAELPVTLGHEISGTVIEIGSNVRDLRVGQEVALNPMLDDRHYGLDACSACVRGKINLCKRFATYGLSAPGGGFADEIVVKAISCLSLPRGVSLKMAALAEPLAVAWHCIQTSGFQFGQNALVLGAGPIGLAILLLLRVWKAGKIFITEVTQQRALQAREFGADMVINPLEVRVESDKSEGNTNTVVAAIRASIDDGVDVVFDAIGLQSTLDTAIAAVKPGGTIFNVAIHEKPLLLNLNDLSCLEKKLMGGICYTSKDFEDVLDAMASSRIQFEQMITSVVPLNNIVDGGFMELINNKAEHAKILIQPSQA